MFLWASLVAQIVKNPSAMQETQVRSLGCEDPLEKAMTTHFSILAWRILWTEEPGALQSAGSKRVGHDLSDQHFHTLVFIQRIVQQNIKSVPFFKAQDIHLTKALCLQQLDTYIQIT